MLYAKNVTVKFGGLVAVNEVSMHIAPGEIHAVIGPNGAGKSTFFNAVSGIYPPTSGQIIFQGEEIQGLRPDLAARKGIGRTFQNIKLFTKLSVFENVLSGCHINVKSNLFQDLLDTPSKRQEEKQLREYASELLQQVDMLDKIDYRAGSLPYGQQRKLEIVRAMAAKPKLLMLDEPAAGMNPSETKELEDFIRKIRDMGLTILLIEHDVKMVMSLADTITVLDHGSKIAEGNAEQVRNDPQVIEAYLGKSRSVG
jgi:branched-chain amino acid transport system ATP-binding protein